MSSIKFEVKLFDVTTYAADGSNIPKESCTEYIGGADYNEVVEKRIGIGGVTHKDRKLDPKYKGVIGTDDQVLISNNATHYYTKLYFKPGDNFLYASGETFDPDLYDGDRKTNIQNLIGDIKSGVGLPVSAVIRALWDRRGKARKIIRFKGFDFTMNPSFKGAGDLKVFDSDEDTQTFSETKSFTEACDFGNDELVEMERVYSFDGSVTTLSSEPVLDKKSLIDTYGLFSEKVTQTEVDKEENFSIPVAINERLINQSQPRFTKIDRILKGHKTYWESKKLTDKQKVETKKLLISDIRTLLMEVSEEVKDGRTYSSLYALSRYSPEIDLISKKLSHTTRRLLIAYSVMDFYPKSLLSDWRKDTVKFYNLLCEYCFGEGLGDLETSVLAETKLS